MYGGTHDERVAILAGIASHAVNVGASMQDPYGESPTRRVAYLFGWQISTPPSTHPPWRSACRT